MNTKSGLCSSNIEFKLAFLNQDLTYKYKAILYFFLRVDVVIGFEYIVIYTYNFMTNIQ